jgi:putative nucleotidyltransferase with HDIG domain
MQLFKKLVLILLAVGCLPLGIASYFLLRTNRAALRSLIGERQQEQANFLARTTDLELAHVTAEIEGHLAQVDLSSMTTADRDLLVRMLLDKHRDDLSVVSIWQEGRQTPAAIAYFGEPAIAAGHLAAVAMTRPDPARAIFTDVYATGDSQPAVTVLVPSRNRGLSLAAEIRLGHLQEDTQHSYVVSGGEVMLVDGRGRVVAARDLTAMRTRADLSKDPFLSRVIGSDPGHSEYEDSTGQGWLAAWAPVRDIGWTAVIEEPRAVALAPAARMLWSTIAIAAITMLGAVAAGIGFARRMSDPIRKVVTGSLSIARGRFGQRVAIERRDEIGELAHTFNYMSQQLSEYDKDNKRLFLDLQRGYIETIRALANSIDAKDPYTRGHSQRVTEYSVELAKEIGLDEEEIARIQFGGILHDIGKIGIREKVLGKQAPLTDEEYEYMKTHPLLGVGIVDPIEFLDRVKPIIRSHHERWDGKGYPDGLKGEDVDIGARIVNIADSYDAMVTQRPYNTPMTWEQAVARLKQIAGSQHDPKLTEAFLKVLDRRKAEEQLGEDWRREESSKGGNVFELPKRGA